MHHTRTIDRFMSRGVERAIVCFRYAIVFDAKRLSPSQKFYNLRYTRVYLVVLIFFLHTMRSILIIRRIIFAFVECDKNFGKICFFLFFFSKGRWKNSPTLGADYGLVGSERFRGTRVSIKETWLHYITLCYYSASLQQAIISFLDHWSLNATSHMLCLLVFFHEFHLSEIKLHWHTFVSLIVWMRAINFRLLYKKWLFKNYLILTLCNIKVF